MFKHSRCWLFQTNIIVLRNSNNSTVMASHSVSRYHAHFRPQDREKGNETMGFLLCVLVVAFGIFCLSLE